MSIDNLTTEEKKVLAVFMNLINHIGRRLSFTFFQDLHTGMGESCIYKKDGKWVTYSFERGERLGYREYDSLYQLCMDTFQCLEKKDTDFCTEVFPKLVQDALAVDEKQATPMVYRLYEPKYSEEEFADAIQEMEANRVKHTGLGLTQYSMSTSGDSESRSLFWTTLIFSLIDPSALSQIYYNGFTDEDILRVFGITKEELGKSNRITYEKVKTYLSNNNGNL